MLLQRGIWLFPCFILCCLPFSGQGLEPIQNAQPLPRLLHVKGTATVYKPPDQLQMQVRVVSQGTTALKALQENNQKMVEVIKSLQAGGLSEKEYKTGRFSIQPIYAERPHSAPMNWRPYITG